MECDRQHRVATLARAQELTGLDNPNSPIKLKEWLTAHGTPLQSLTKDEVAAALDSATGQVREVLQLRGELAKSSVKKYEAMQHVAGRDGRGRGSSSSTGQGALAGSQAAWFKSRTCLATTCPTWPRPEDSCGSETLVRWSCSMTPCPTPSLSSSAPHLSPLMGTGSWWLTSLRSRRG
ncbi:hypothetical protein [Corynebacterium silvaticum]|uniref:Uncharacterized protein n=1 Tax=Corynebacterium silvaticum TaxID=2320431 RepID=A0ACD4PXW2_9CORY|nr:hypothetical protein [Corynebacterium silvaticum]UWH03696.1 hypothetical protein K1I36_07635 [Corynebacterium silvaticum]UXZ25857.1 hypothetical protein K3929_07630 [Corynebacterium silvaticum]UXZ27891.1 hypothetical protein K3930_07610 [Corynebacterium silvaticum]UXZ29936.1 hypothetical protein K3934_07640 [Corynebacterium silvaticum]UXZ31979.1 hypothetical protein K3911_07640 [Corynebacterium silvaticum]